ncbi:unnamed protein product [Rhizoctonia solani]|uniref:Uncharacterized protein n=1 Tax=Rhizoctonia solani TaxID=456999 RepID=A0A8H3GJ81_9AGAM|nr:unnamed protein product [Rhizoctonia solani]
MSQANNNIARALQSLYALVDSIPQLLANHPTNSQFQQMKSQLEESNRLLAKSVEGMGKTLEEMDKRMEGQFKKIDGQFEKVDRRFDQLTTSSKAQFDDIQDKLDFNHEQAHARALNSCAHLDEGPIYPLPLPGGGQLPEGELPGTAWEFRRIDTYRLYRLLHFYGLPIQTDNARNHAVLSAHLGIRWL